MDFLLPLKIMKNDSPDPTPHVIRNVPYLWSYSCPHLNYNPWFLILFPILHLSQDLRIIGYHVLSFHVHFHHQRV